MSAHGEKTEEEVEMGVNERHHRNSAKFSSEKIEDKIKVNFELPHAVIFVLIFFNTNINRKMGVFCFYFHYNFKIF